MPFAYSSISQKIMEEIIQWCFQLNFIKMTAVHIFHKICAYPLMSTVRFAFGYTTMTMIK